MQYENTFDEGVPRPGKAELEAKVLEAERVALEAVRETIPLASAFHFGAYHIDPQHMAFWIMTETDAERDAVLTEGVADAAFRRALAERGYPRKAIPLITVTAESQETVDRDFGGNWWHAVK